MLIEMFRRKPKGREAKHVFFFQFALRCLKPSSHDSFRCVDMVIRRDVIVGVRKGRFMVKTLRHYNFGPNVLFLIL